MLVYGSNVELRSLNLFKLGLQELKLFFDSTYDLLGFLDIDFVVGDSASEFSQGPFEEGANFSAVDSASDCVHNRCPDFLAVAGLDQPVDV